jgi:hypothetical protein
MLLAVAMVIVVAVPAGAAKPDKPGKPGPELFEVTFGFVDGELGFSKPGLSTSEECGGSITMEAGPGGRLGAVPGQLIDVNLRDIQWYRYYPYVPDGDSANFPEGFDPIDDFQVFDEDEYPQDAPFTGRLEGCHGGGIDVYVPKVPNENEPFTTRRHDGPFTLTIGNGTVDLTWHSDFYAEWLVTAPRKPHQEPKKVLVDIEDFSYVDNHLAWTSDDGSGVVWDNQTGETTGTVSGSINVTHFWRASAGYWGFEGSPVEVEFTMTIAPKT